MANPKDLNLGSDPLPSAPESPFQKWLDCIETMREDGRWDWADGTLTGIYDTIAARKYVSGAQMQAVRNIRDKNERAAEECDIEHL